MSLPLAQNQPCSARRGAGGRAAELVQRQAILPFDEVERPCAFDFL
ncbi:hypothetical protein MTR72_27015 [Bradyrhizobium sp. ISRA442]